MAPGKTVSFGISKGIAESSEASSHFGVDRHVDQNPEIKQTQVDQVENALDYMELVQTMFQ